MDAKDRLTSLGDADAGLIQILARIKMIFRVSNSQLFNLITIESEFRYHLISVSEGALASLSSESGSGFVNPQLILRGCGFATSTS